MLMKVPKQIDATEFYPNQNTLMKFPILSFWFWAMHSAIHVMFRISCPWVS